MGAPEQYQSTSPPPQQQAQSQPFAAPLANTNTGHEIQSVDRAVVPAAHTDALPPSYEKSAGGAPGQPRGDDVARAEMGFNAAPQAPAMVTPLQSLAYDPAWIDCPFCRTRSQTDVKKTESDTTWIYTLLCCLCCGCIGALFPILLGWGNDFDHYCKSCGNRVARVPHEGGSGSTQTYGPQVTGGVPSQLPAGITPTQSVQPPK